MENLTIFPNGEIKAGWVNFYGWENGRIDCGGLWEMRHQASENAHRQAPVIYRIRVIPKCPA